MKPVLVYDGNCGFCKIWIGYWKQLTGDAIDYAASQDVAPEYPQVPAEEFKWSVQLILPSGEVFSGAHAVFQTLAFNPSRRFLLSMYDRLPGFAGMTEAAYRLVASHRNLFYRLTVILFGRTVEPLRYDAIQWLFRKLLAVVWLIAFVSFWVQARGLVESNGIQPIGMYLTEGVCLAGVVCALLVLAGVFWRGALFLAFILYLSLVNTSQEFLSYQWDVLVLEAGFSQCLSAIRMALFGCSGGCCSAWCSCRVRSNC